MRKEKIDDYELLIEESGDSFYIGDGLIGTVQPNER